MTVLNAGVTIDPGTAAGLNGTARLVAVDAAGLRGLAGVTTGASALVAGALALIHLATPVTADMDAFATAVLGATNVGAFAGVEILITPFTPAPPAGVVFFPVAQLTQGQVTGFGIGTSGALLPGTTYRFSWRVLT